MVKNFPGSAANQFVASPAESPAISIWMDLVTSRSHTSPDTHTQMKLDSSVRDRGHRTISRDVQFQHAVSLSLKFALFSFTLECSSYKQCQQPSKDRQQKRLLRSLLLPHFGSSSLHSVFIDYLRSSVKGLTGYLCEHWLEKSAELKEALILMFLSPV